MFSKIAAAVACAAIFVGARPVKADMGINPQGTFTDIATWIYKNADGKFSYGPPMTGTNEVLLPATPQPPSGGAVVGILHVRHQMVTQGYPLHVSMIDKLFAKLMNVQVSASNGNELWSYDPADPVAKETMVQGAGAPAFTATGPLLATGAIPPEYKAAFDFATGAMNALTNLPAGQKDLAHYQVLFVETSQTVWIEFAPELAPEETPQLGCQWQLGRDMVFSVSKSGPPTPEHGAAFLQCF